MYPKHPWSAAVTVENGPESSGPCCFYPAVTLTQAGTRSINELSELKHRRVKVGGLIVTPQSPPTAKSTAFLGLEDPTEMVNVVVAQQVYVQYREAIHSTFVIIEGVVQKEKGAINVLAREVLKV